MSKQLVSVARRGRPSSVAATPLENFVEQLLESQSKTRTQLAEALHVHPSTVTRFLRGAISEIDAFSGDDVVHFLGLSAVQRRQFLKLVAEAGITFIAPATRASGTIVLELLDRYADSLYHNLDSGEATYVFHQARSVARLLQARFPESDDPEIVRRQLHFGVLQANAQESHFPWYQRAARTIVVHNTLIDRVLVRFPERGPLAQEFARIYERRAPLFRELQRYDESLEDFGHALELTRYFDDPEMAITLLRNRAHVHAVLGNERAWLMDLEHAQRLAEHLAGEQRIFHQGLIEYSRAEGYKRLAYLQYPSLSWQRRLSYAQRALDCFARSQVVVQGARFGHYVLADVSAAQTLIWLDPTDALARFATLKTRASRALLDKIDRSEQFARQRLAARRSNSEIILDLDHSS